MLRSHQLRQIERLAPEKTDFVSVCIYRASLRERGRVVVRDDNQVIDLSWRIMWRQFYNSLIGHIELTRVANVEDEDFLSFHRFAGIDQVIVKRQSAHHLALESTHLSHALE